MAAKNEFLDEGVGSGSGGAGAHTDCRFEEKPQEEWRELRAVMLQVRKAGPRREMQPILSQNTEWSIRSWSTIC